MSATTSRQLASTTGARRLGAGLATLALAGAGVLVTGAPAYALDHFATDELSLEVAAIAAVSGETIYIQNDISLSGTISFPAGVTVRGDEGVFVIDRGVAGDFDLFSLDPVAAVQEYVFQDLEFDGDNTAGKGHAFTVDNAGSSVRNLTFDNVSIHDFTADSGAAVYLDNNSIGGMLTVQNGSNFSNNTAETGAGGAIGGDIFQGSLTLTDSSFSDNESVLGTGGAIGVTHTGGFTTLTAANLTVERNEADGDGGAFFLDGFQNTSTFTGSRFAENVAGGNGGAIFGDNLGFGLVIDSTTFADNTSAGSGGAVYLEDTADATVRAGSLFDSNHADGDGGGLYLETTVSAVIMQASTFTSNDAGNGGAAYFGGLTALSGLTDMVFQENSTAFSSTSHGGALWISASSAIPIRSSRFIDNYSWNGGAIYLPTVSTDFSIGTGTTFDGNSAGGDVLLAGFGGAIYAETITSTGYMRFFNSTFMNQSLQSGFGGNGISIYVGTIDPGGTFQLGEVTLSETATNNFVVAIGSSALDSRVIFSNSTIVGDYGVGFTFLEGDADLTHMLIQSSFVSISTPGPGTVGLEWSLLSDDPATSYTDLGNNLVDTDALLGPLQDNGGATWTHLPSLGSPAIDAGDPNVLAGTYDQRIVGFPRILNGRIDIGAVEVTPLLAATGHTVSWWLLPVGGIALVAGIAAVVVMRLSRARARLSVGRD